MPHAALSYHVPFAAHLFACLCPSNRMVAEFTERSRLISIPQPCWPTAHQDVDVPSKADPSRLRYCAAHHCGACADSGAPRCEHLLQGVRRTKSGRGAPVGKRCVHIGSSSRSIEPQPMGPRCRTSSGITKSACTCDAKEKDVLTAVYRCRAMLAHLRAAKRARKSKMRISVDTGVDSLKSCNDARGDDDDSSDNASDLFDITPKPSSRSDTEFTLFETKRRRCSKTSRDRSCKLSMSTTPVSASEPARFGRSCGAGLPPWILVQAQGTPRTGRRASCRRSARTGRRQRRVRRMCKRPPPALERPPRGTGCTSSTTTGRSPRAKPCRAS